MPIFEYHCHQCDKDFEILIIGDGDVSCPECEGKNVSKLPSVFSHKSETGFTSSGRSSCSSCTAGSCETCGRS
ncbi:MAG: FmdB family zinc ribbon protein [Thermodesulfobacteriota bacterium]